MSDLSTFEALTTPPFTSGKQRKQPISPILELTMRTSLDYCKLTLMVRSKLKQVEFLSNLLGDIKSLHKKGDARFSIPLVTDFLVTSHPDQMWLKKVEFLLKAISFARLQEFREAFNILPIWSFREPSLEQRAYNEQSWSPPFITVDMPHCSLFDRPAEMSDLIKEHSDFFDGLKDTFNLYGTFIKLLSIPRCELGDSQWMIEITKLFTNHPTELCYFKCIVGYGHYRGSVKQRLPWTTIVQNVDQSFRETLIPWVEASYWPSKCVLWPPKINCLNRSEANSPNYIEFYTNHGIFLELFKTNLSQHNISDQYISFLSHLRIPSSELSDDKWIGLIIGRFLFRQQFLVDMFLDAENANCEFCNSTATRNEVIWSDKYSVPKRADRLELNSIINAYQETLLDEIKNTMTAYYGSTAEIKYKAFIFLLKRPIYEMSDQEWVQIIDNELFTIDPLCNQNLFTRFSRAFGLRQLLVSESLPVAQVYTYMEMNVVVPDCFKWLDVKGKVGNAAFEGVVKEYYENVVVRSKNCSALDWKILDGLVKDRSEGKEE